MSKKRKLFLLLALVSLIWLAVACLLGVVGGYQLLPAAMVIIFALAVFELYMNLLTRRRLSVVQASFGTSSRIRNVDRLVIGVPPKGIDLSNTVVINDAYTNPASAFELLKHTHSIVREGGQVIVSCSSKRLDKSGFSMLSLLFFHRITVTKYSLEREKRKLVLPFLYHPFQSLALIARRMDVAAQPVECPTEEMIAFCKERSLELVFMAY